MHWYFACARTTAPLHFISLLNSQKIFFPLRSSVCEYVTSNLVIVLARVLADTQKSLELHWYMFSLILKYWKVFWMDLLVQDSHQEWPVNTERSVWKCVPFLRFTENSLSSCSFSNVFLVPVYGWYAALEHLWILQCTKDRKDERMESCRERVQWSTVPPRGRNRHQGKKA